MPPPTVYLVTPLSAQAREWISKHVAVESIWFAGGLAVEHRYIDDFVIDMVGDGLIRGEDFDLSY